MNPALKDALDNITGRGIALKRVIEVSAPLRVARGREISADGKVSGLQENAERIQAKVLASADAGVLRAPYTVSISFDGPRVLTHCCSCPDHGKSGACKHVIALAFTWAEKVGRPVYRALKSAEKVAA